MEWQVLSKSEAAEITGEWNRMDENEFQLTKNAWKDTIVSDLSDEYKTLREEVNDSLFKIPEQIEKAGGSKAKRGYYTDLFFAKDIYQIFEKRGFDVRKSSNDYIWYYLSVKVFPDIVHARYPGSTYINSKGEREKRNINEDRFWRKRKRIYLKVLWWYIYLSLQFDESGHADLDATVEMLKNNSSDEIVQLVERSGSAGYRVSMYRALMKYYSENRDKYSNSDFRKVMVLNTARSRIVEPALVDGGDAAYVRELFNYFEER